MGRGGEAGKAGEEEALSGTPQSRHTVEEFRPLLESAFAKERKSPAGRKRIDVIVMLRILVLQQLHNLSDEEVEFPSE